MRTLTKWVVLTVACITTPSWAQETTQADFQKWCSLVEGRWVGTVKWVTDWQGFGKKGEQATAFWQGRRSIDGKVLFTKFLGGGGSDNGLTYYDAAAKRIRRTHVGSGGAVFQAILWRSGDNWKQEVDVSRPDGTRGKMTALFTFAEGGTKLTILVDSKIGKDVVKGQRDVWRRISNVPPVAAKGTARAATAGEKKNNANAGGTRSRRNTRRRLRGVLRRRRQ